MVFMAVMIRTEKSTDAQTLTTGTASRLPSQLIEVSQVNKRSALHTTTEDNKKTSKTKISTDEIVSAQMLKETNFSNNSEIRNFMPIEVPIKIVFDPRLVPAESAPHSINQRGEIINNFITATSNELKSGKENKVQPETQISTEQEEQKEGNEKRKKKRKSALGKSIEDKNVDVELDEIENGGSE